MNDCSCQPETFLTLLRDAAHWEFELFLMLAVDGLVLGLGWRFFHRWLHRHFNKEVP